MGNVVDYAGLFPPASLHMSDAVSNYASYSGSDDAWMLGRFIVPVSRLSEWNAAVSALTREQHLDWSGSRLSVLLSDDFSREADEIDAFNAAEPFGVRIDACEGRASSPDTVLAMSASMPASVSLYCEIPHRTDPLSLLQAVRSAGVCAKIRIGGVTPDAFPTVDEIVRFLRHCHTLDVPAKATAGLHHPLRGEYRLTYQPDAEHGVMFGFLNLLLAAALVRDQRSDADVRAMLLLRDGNAIRFTPSHVIVCSADESDGRRALEIPVSTLAAVRSSGVVGFGSCSFREPVDELASIVSGVSQ
jgi:hypothetical protein